MSTSINTPSAPGTILPPVVAPPSDASTTTPDHTSLMPETLITLIRTYGYVRNTR